MISADILNNEAEKIPAQSFPLNEIDYISCFTFSIIVLGSR